MCVIIHKPEGIKLGIDTIEKCWKDNPDGAGLAYWQGTQIVVRKGLMTLVDAKRAIAELGNRELVVHFRTATAGKVNPQQTHPFAIARHFDVAKAYNTDKLYESVLFHNGIINHYGTDDYSDTLHFVVKVLAKLHGRDRVRMLKLVPGKFALLQHGKIYLIGDFIARDGCKFSNCDWSYSCFLPNWSTSAWDEDMYQAPLAGKWKRSKKSNRINWLK